MKTIGHLSVLIKPASGYCNLHCDYCFYNDEMSNRVEQKTKFMSHETLEVVIEKVLKATTTYCSFMFQGGEPTLVGLEFYQKVVEFQKKYNVHHTKITNAIQTNGILLDSEFLDFCKKHKFLIGLSIDGPQEVHDHYRHTKSGKGTFEQVLNTLHEIQKREIEYSVLSVITEYSSNWAKQIYNFIVSENIQNFQFIPALDALNQNYFLSCLDKTNQVQSNELANKQIAFKKIEKTLSNVGRHRVLNVFQGKHLRLVSQEQAFEPPVTLEQIQPLKAKSFAKFMIEFFNEWFYEHLDNNFQIYRSIRHFENYMAIILRMEPPACNMTGHCSMQYVIESDGSIYPCDFFALDSFNLGNIKDIEVLDAFRNEKTQAFIKRSFELPEECSKCKYIYFCRGGCYRDRLNYEGHNRFCSSFKQFFDECLERLEFITFQFKYHNEQGDPSTPPEQSK